MTYGKLIDGTLERAGKTIVHNGSVLCNPTPPQLKRAGYLPVIDTPPETESGYHAVPSGYVCDDTSSHIVRTYTIAPDDPAPAPATRTFDVYRLMLALKGIEVPGDPDTPNATAKDAAVAWAHEHGVYEELLTIGRISEDDNDFADALASLKSVLSLTDDQVATVLAASEVK